MQAGVHAKVWKNYRYISPSLWQIVFYIHNYLSGRLSSPLSSPRIGTTVLHNTPLQCWFCTAPDQDREEGAVAAESVSYS
jgi:hypothetical protein